VPSGDIPASVREEVHARDEHFCRCCGRYVEHPQLHHITYRSQGGRHELGNLISLCFSCHAKKAHGPENRTWQELFAQVIDMPGVTAAALARWQGKTLR